MALNVSGDWPGTLAELHEVVRLKPSDFYAHYGIATILLRAGDLDGAVAECREAIRLNPQYPFTYECLGSILFAQGDLEGAVTQYRESIRHDPRDYLSYLGLSFPLRRLNRLDEAVAALHHARELAAGDKNRVARAESACPRSRG